MLTFLLLFPAVASLFFLFPGSKQKLSGFLALAVSILEFIFAIAAFMNFNAISRQDYILTAIPKVNNCITANFSIDGISILLVLLTTIVILFTLWISVVRNKDYPAAFYFLVLIMEASLIGVFTTNSGLLFYIFWEMALIPVYFIAAIWGGENRIRITIKFFIYTMLGSLFMLGALIYLYVRTPVPHEFGFDHILSLPLSQNEQTWLVVAFFIAFAIKIPIFPFHSWQPDTYAVAPPEGAILLAGIMLKMGLYGIIRFILPLTNHMITPVLQIIIILSIISILYGSLLALAQQEFKRLIAYASLAHVGLMAAAIYSQRADAIEGALYQMIAHGINIIALFFIADIIERRTATTKIRELGGIAHSAPYFSIFFMIVMLGTIAFPLTNGFIGEFLMLAGLSKYNIYLAAVAGISIILAAIYMFRLYRTTMYGETNELTASFNDLNLSEMFVSVPLILLIIGMGIYTNPVLAIAKTAIDALLR